MKALYLTALILLIPLVEIATVSASVTVFREDFEGTFPGTWSVGDNNPNNGNDYWGDTAYRPSFGSRSAWSAEIGNQELSQFASNDNDVNIPDNNGWVFSAATVSGAPSGATVTKMDVHYEIVHTYMGDLDVDLHDEDFTYNYHLHENTGGSDDNISETVSGITLFNGELVNQEWRIYAQDTGAWDTGYIDYWWIKPYYEQQNTELRQYDDNMAAYMKYQIDLQGYVNSQLSYHYWVDVEKAANCAYDCLEVQTSSDGEIWVVKKRYSEGYDSKDGDPYARTWYSDYVDLSAYDGSNVWIRFFFKTDGSVHNREGAYIDEVKVTATPAVTVSGTLYYKDNNGQDRPIKRANVELWDKDEEEVDDCLANSCTTNFYTDDNGYYSFPTIANKDVDADSGLLDIYLKVIAENPSSVRVINSSNEVYINKSGVEDNIPSGSQTVDHTIDDSTAGAYNIFNAIVKGHQYVDNLPNTPAPAQITVKWYPGNTDGTHYHKGGEIHILGNDDPTTWAPDEWDEGVILHEYGHYIAYLYNADNSPGGDHFWDEITNNELAWSEGWGHYLSSATRNIDNYRDTWDGGYFEANLESGIAVEVVNGAQTGSWNGNNCGSACEAAVAGTLWDIYDSINDDQNGDDIGDNLYTGSNDIWDVIHYYTTGGHGVYTIHEFWDGWFDRNHNNENKIWAVYYEHGINKDTSPPSSSVSPLSSTQSSTSFTVSWSGSDSGYSGLRWYDIQYKDGSSGSWTNWLTQTTSTSETFTGTNGHTYYFQSRAQDYAGNWEAYPGGNGDTYTTVSTGGGGGDSSPPEISFVSIVEGWITALKDVFVSWTASDPESGINHYEVQLNSSPGTGWIDVGLNTSYTFYNTSEDNHTFYLKAVDNANNTAIEDRNFTVNTSYVEPVSETEPQADIHVFFMYGYDLQPNDTVSADIILQNEGGTALEDGIRIMVLDSTGMPAYKTWKRIEINANDAIRIRFRDYEIPANAQPGIWMFKVEFTEDAKWTPPGFRYFGVG